MQERENVETPELTVAQDSPLAHDPNTLKQLLKMFGKGDPKRGVTKPRFNRVKARKRDKMQKLARKAGRGSNRGKGSAHARLNRAGAPR